MGAMTLFSEDVEHVAECGSQQHPQWASLCRYMSVPSASAASCLIDGEVLHRQGELSSVERLDLALLVNRQNDGVVRRIDKKADDVAQLGDELRVIGELEPTHSVRLQAVGPPDALYRTDADPDRFPWLRPSNGWRFGTVPPRSRPPRARQPREPTAGCARAAFCRATGRRRLRR
jgi:hypothetical protein